jgi:ABC-type phosphate transport system substrate-binding protein
MRPESLCYGALAAFFALAMRAPVCSAQVAIAVIVSPKTSVNNLSIEELRRIFLGSSTTLPGNGPVILVEHTAERPAFYRAALGMSEDRVKRHWIQMVFAGDGATPPREIDELDAVKRFVAEHSGAIAFLSESAVDVNVKVLSIDGQRPGDPGYPLR